MGKLTRHTKNWTEEEKQAYRDQLKRAIAPRHPENFRHFDTPEQWQAHREGVKQDQGSGSVPF